MRALDAHVHLYPAAVNRDPAAWAAANGEPHWATLCTRRRKDGRPVQLFPNVDELLRTMDAAGVERSVLLGWYWETPAACAQQNRFYADCVRAHPDRLSAFATVHPADGAALVEVHWAREQGFCGLGELSPHSLGIAVGDPRWRDVLALAGELALPVNLHVTEPESRPFPGRVETPLEDFVTMARDFPRTRFILAHWGGGLAFQPRMRAAANVWFDTAASPLLYGPDVWTQAVAAVGAERLLFGSDFPLRLYPTQEEGDGLATFVAAAVANLSPETRDRALRTNAAALLC